MLLTEANNGIRENSRKLRKPMHPPMLFTPFGPIYTDEEPTQNNKPFTLIEEVDEYYEDVLA